MARRHPGRGWYRRTASLGVPRAGSGSMVKPSIVATPTGSPPNSAWLAWWASRSAARSNGGRRGSSTVWSSPSTDGSSTRAGSASSAVSLGDVPSALDTVDEVFEPAVGLGGHQAVHIGVEPREAFVEGAGELEVFHDGAVEPLAGDEERNAGRIRRDQHGGDPADEVVDRHPLHPAVREALV